MTKEIIAQLKKNGKGITRYPNFKSKRNYEIWELHTYDRNSYWTLAKKFNITPQRVQQVIKAVDKEVEEL